MTYLDINTKYRTRSNNTLRIVYSSTPPDSTYTTDTSSFNSANSTPPPRTPDNDLYRKLSYNKLKDKLALQLTSENVLRVGFADSTSMPLARYCHQLERSTYTPTTYAGSTHSNARRKIRKQSKDSVIESPRVLSFPFHNDSYFLPTAEQDYPGRGSIVTDGGSSIVSVHTFNSGNRLNHSNAVVSKSNHQIHHMFSLPKKQKAKKNGDRTLFGNHSLIRQPQKQRGKHVTHESNSDSVVPQKKHRGHPASNLSYNLKKKLLRLKPSDQNKLPVKEKVDYIPKNHLPLLPNVQPQKSKSLEVSEAQKTGNRPWYKKIWRLLKPPSDIKSEMH